MEICEKERYINNIPKNCMFCSKCGNAIADDSLFCSKCGVQIQPSEVTSTPEQPQEIAAAVQPENTSSSTVISNATEATNVLDQEPQTEIPTEEDFETPPFSGPATNPKKPFKKLLKFIIPACALIIVAVILLNWATISGGIVKLFTSDKTYFEYVQNKATNQFAENFSNYYGNYLDTIQVDSASKATLSFTVGDNFSKLFPELDTENGFDFDFLNETTLDLNINNKGDLASYALALSMNNKDILSLNAIADFDDEKCYLGLPELSNEFLFFDLSEIADDSSNVDIAQQQVFLNDLKKALPEKKVLENLIKKYSEIAYKNISNVEESLDILKINDISEKCTKIEIIVTLDDAENICEDLLDEAKNDKDLQNIYNDVRKVLIDYELINDYYALDYEGFCEDLEDSMEEYFDNNKYSDKKLKIEQFVNSKHQIIGWAIKSGRDDVLSVATVTKDKSFESEVILYDAYEGDDVIIIGSGKASLSALNATYDVTIDKKEILSVKVKDLNLKNGHINGNFKIMPSSEFDSLLSYNERSKFLNLDPSLEIDIKSAKNSATVSVNIYSDDEILFGIKEKAVVATSKKISIPKASDTYDVSDSEELMDWVAGLDLSDLIYKLKDTDAPKELIDFLEELEDALDYYSGYEAA